MNRVRFAMLAAAAMIAPLLTAAPAAPAATVSPFSGAVLFSDSFSGAEGAPPTPGAWTDYSGCTYNSSAAFGDIGCGNNETQDGAGDLQIPATPTIGSAIRVASKYAYEYGVWSAWIKAPAQGGYWPGFWTLNNNYNGVDATHLGEADAYEEYTSLNPDLYHANAHNWNTNGEANTGTADSTCGDGQDLSAGWHKYSVQIAPSAVTFYLDSTRCGQVFTPATNPGASYGFGPAVTRGNWMILDLAVGGAGGQQPTPTAAAAMLVARVEVRALP